MFNALVLTLPTRNSTLRMRVWRALRDSGCAMLRDGVYLLPDGAPDAVLKDVEREIRSNGGFAMTFAADPRGGEGIESMFDRSDEYGELVRRITATRASLARLGPRRGQTAVRRMERAFEKVASIDFFPGEARKQAVAALDALKAARAGLHSRTEPRPSMRGLRRLDPARYQKRVWATRKSPWVDRLACAWLIKRFIDRDAKFVWLERPSELPGKAIGFDYDGAKFTHVKTLVTFEVLVASFGLDGDPGLAAIAPAVHFLDAGGIPVADAKMLEAMLKGARERTRSDDALLAEAMRMFDFLYSGYRAKS